MFVALWVQEPGFVLMPAVEPGYTLAYWKQRHLIPLFFREYGQELDQAKLSVYQRIHDFVD